MPSTSQRGCLHNPSQSDDKNSDVWPNGQIFRENLFGLERYAERYAWDTVETITVYKIESAFLGDSLGGYVAFVGRDK